MTLSPKDSKESLRDKFAVFKFYKPYIKLSVGQKRGVDDIISAVEEWAREIIGGDKPLPPGITDGYLVQKLIRAKNELRAEQRERAGLE